MDDHDRIFAEITKINFLLENLWLARLIEHGRSPSDAQRIADDLRKQWQTPPTRHGSQQPGEWEERHHEYVAARIDDFFATIRTRLARRLPGDGRHTG